MPTYSGRIRRSLSLSTVNECAQPIRCAITVAGIRGYSTSNARTCASTPSASVGCSSRSYFGGRSDASAARTVFLEIPNRRATSLTETPSARCNRRISAQSSTLITLQDHRGWSVFARRHLLSLHPSSTAAAVVAVPAGGGGGLGSGDAGRG